MMVAVILLQELFSLKKPILKGVMYDDMVILGCPRKLVKG